MADAVLVKYKQLKLLIQDIDADISELTPHLDEINKIESDWQALLTDMLAPDADTKASALKKRVEDLGLGYLKIIGSPFTPARDAELYALNEKIDFEVLELHGLTGKPGNAIKNNESATATLQCRIPPSLKAAAVKQAQANNMKLCEFVLAAVKAKLTD